VKGLGHGGASAAWPPSGGVRSSPRVLLVDERRLQVPQFWVPYLESRGVEQIIAPEALTGDIVEAWANSTRRAGWVLAWSEVLRDTAPARPLRVPTAVVLPASSPKRARAFEYAQAWSREGVVAFWVVPPGAEIDGQRIEDIVTNQPAIDLPEDTLR